MQQTPVLKGISVVSISVPDLDAAREFYSEVLGLGEPLYELPDAGWIEFGLASGQGNSMKTTASAGSSRPRPSSK
ncbi:VOC family protein [Silicimonas algicola]|uniref:Glyoxalase/fosfomycin resistance/dioxygenase domain-containing protein n=1 Tax=Silicimonas algicola TaxID=1826607 RepID=A0A316G3U7_9RHOB|nr:VOC family protein [Silicimonas algicola]PWK54995.1 hypothetical protein C8D95_10982 [Silicimonas algicola]